MAITIKELLASDTLSDAVDKINFNFDQLLLNGGGPQGPNGPIGPIGPIGGRGIRGTQWFEDPISSPGTDPNSLTFVDLEEGDNYLQSDGTVWEWNGTVWVATSVNLTGPQGSAGTSGFSRFGNPINNQQSIYISPMPGGTGAGADNFNEAVPTLVVGGFVSITPITTGVTYQESLITDSLAQQFNSTNSAMIVHQLNANSSAIRFMGGDNVSDNYEQSNISDLAFISLDSDDRLRIQVPKTPINTSSLINLSGYIVNTIETGQYHASGKHIHFITGQSTNSSGSVFENSDFNVTVNKSNGTSGNPRILLNVTPVGGGLPASINIGSNTAIPVSTANTGSVIVTGGLIGLVGSSTIGLTTSSNISQLAVGNITLNSGSVISGTATGNITFNSGNSIQLTATNDLIINVTDDITVTGGDNLTINITDLINVSAGQNITIGSSANVLINANSIIRLDAEKDTTPNIINLPLLGGITPALKLIANAAIHAEQSTGVFANTQVNVQADRNIFMSGTIQFLGDGSTGVGGFGVCNGLYTRVGNVVNVFAIIFNVTCTGDTLTIPIPLKNQTGILPNSTIGARYGFGVINNANNDQVVIAGTGNNVNVISPNVADLSTVAGSTQGIRISYSYIIE